MSLSPWSHSCSAGFTLRGWRSEPSGKPLLHFLHGSGFCGRTYEPMLRLLAEDFDLWLCDIQGHGESDHGGRFHGWNRNAEMSVEAFEAGRGPYGDVQRLACGHSFGGVLSSPRPGPPSHPVRPRRAARPGTVHPGDDRRDGTFRDPRPAIARQPGEEGAPAPQPVARSRSRLRRLARPRYLQGLDRRGAVGLRGICAEGRATAESS